MILFIYPQLLDNNLLHKELDYLKFVTLCDEIYKEQNKTFDQKKDILENFEDYINKIMSEIFKNKNRNKNNCHNNVLNILDGNNPDNLISNFEFVEFMKTSPINNLIIFKNGTSTINTDILLSASNYYKVVLKDKNILIKSMNSSTSVFGAINDNYNYFVDWCPLY